MQSINYLVRSIMKFNQRKCCPNCGSDVSVLVDKKYFFTRLLKCKQCNLSFRHPTDKPDFLNNFYQSSYSANYSDETVSITDLPSDEKLNQLMKENFPDKRNHSSYVKALLKSEVAKVLDYGCSWGYSVFQLKKAGYQAEGFEISKPRADFGKKIDITIHHKQDNIDKDFDLIMSNHAIEHLPVISDFVKFSSSRLKDEGIFMAFCPNGSIEYRNREPKIFHVNWGFLHPNYLDIEFATTTFQKNPYLILTGDWNYDLNDLANWDGQSQVTGSRRDGKELLIISKPNIYLA